MNPWLRNLLCGGGGGGGGPVLPPTGRTMLANLTSSLILDEGTGGPTWSRATKAWGFNELGYLGELANGCAFFGGARLVRNLCTSNSDNFSAATLGRCSIVSAAVANHRGTNTAVKYLLENTAGAHYARISSVAYAGMVIRVSVIVKRDEYQYVAVTSGKSEAFNLTTNTWINAAKTETVARSFEVIDATWIRLTAAVTVPTGTAYFGVSFVNSLGSDWTPAGTENITIADVSIVDVTNYDPSYVPEYVSVGVVASPFFGAGSDGAEYFETDWQGAPLPAASLLGFRREASAINNLLHSRDLSNAAWSTKTNVTAAKTATGLDGIANTATTLTFTAADAIILQPTSGIASAARCASAYVKRRTGTGTISFTQDGGSTWTDITAQINGSTWSRVQITSTLANPSVGFKGGTLGDEIYVDCVQNEAGAKATSPIVTTTTTVTRNADSLTYPTAGNIDFAVGTIYGECQSQANALSLTRSIALIGSSYFGVSSTGLINVRIYDGTTICTGSATTDITTAKRKRSGSWGPGGLVVSGDGVIANTAVFDGSFGDGATINIGSNTNGYVGPVAIYNYQMTDAELQALTT